MALSKEQWDAINDDISFEDIGKFIKIAEGSNYTVAFTYWTGEDIEQLIKDEMYDPEVKITPKLIEHLMIKIDHSEYYPTQDSILGLLDYGINCYDFEAEENNNV